MGSTSRRAFRSAVFVVIASVFAAVVPGLPASPASAQAMTAAQINAELGVGVNLGNALEAPREGDWGLTLTSSYFADIAERGFGHVRVPVRFSAYASAVSPYTIPDGIDPTVPNANNLWERIDWVIANAEANGLYVILDLHHFHELSANVAGERDRFLGIWSQIATRYANAGPSVLFELLNEPRGQFIDDPALLNALIADALAVVRTTNPTRPVIVGPTDSNSLYFLDELQLPNDPNLIASFHFYEPFEFTHQGAGWIEPEPPPLTSFQPDLIGHGAGWGDWSWSTTTIPSVNGLRVQHQNRWAGLMFGRPELVDPVSLQATISGDADLIVRCLLNNGLNGDDGNHVVDRFTSTDTPSVFTWDLTVCPSDTRGINFMVRSQTFDELLYSDVELCDAQGACHQMLQTGRDAMRAAFDRAHAWGLENGIPINVGEFGTFSANGQASLTERAAWTEIVRQLGTDRGFSMSYWEFGAGFGVYDPASEMWVEPIAEALGVERRVIPRLEGLGFVPTTPCAVFDSRASGSVVQGQATVRAQVVGSVGQSGTACAAGGVVPAGASAVMVNVVAVRPVAGGNLRIAASGSTAQGGVVNFSPGVTNSNAVPVGLSVDGAVDVFVNAPASVAATDVRLVVLGYYT